MDEVMATGAVVTGRRTFEHAGGWGGDHHDGVPIFVLTRRQSEATTQWPAVTYVSDVKDAVYMAKEAADDKDVLIHGAVTAQLALTAGALDELNIHLITGLTRAGSPAVRGHGHRSTSSWNSPVPSAGQACSTCATACRARQHERHRPRRSDHTRDAATLIGLRADSSGQHKRVPAREIRR